MDQYNMHTIGKNRRNESELNNILTTLKHIMQL